MKYVWSYLITLAVFLAIDVVWLTVISKNFYAKNLGYLMKENPNLLAALIFYLIFVFGLLVLVIWPNMNSTNLKLVLLSGLFGLVSYATYDLTNLATIDKWPIVVTIVDMVWGFGLSATTAVISRLLIKILIK